MLITKEQIVGVNRMSKQDKINIFESLLMSTGRTGIDKVIEYLRKTDFYDAPASAKYHSNYETGLLDHSLMVYSIAEAFFEKMKLKKVLSFLLYCMMYARFVFIKRQ